MDRSIVNKEVLNLSDQFNKILIELPTGFGK